jgi:SSS family solute:Na+ symporter
MTIFGLHYIDALVIAVYIAVILWIGKRASEKTKDTGDFFLAGRKLGKAYQFFLNFGASTNADQAVAVSREVYRQGIGGMWIQFLVLFLTPFYWFTTFLFRRVRLTTIGDYFTERFKSKMLGAGYAVFILFTSILGGGIGFMVAAKTMMALTPKSVEECTPEQRSSIEEFEEFQALRAKTFDGLSPQERARLEVLNEKNKHGELHSFYSHTDPLVFYIGFALIVGIYTMLGGFRAAAITDSIQGVLIIIFSIILVPIGLQQIGGFSGLHASVPAFMFELFGSVTLSEYAWYTILAMVLANLVSIVAVVSGMQTCGSAKDEMTARFGMVGGMFLKRVIMIFWALTGLLAVGLFAGQIHDPDLIWGVMTRNLLAPGLIGLMLVGILAANMSTLDATAVSYSALFINNLYKPVRSDFTERHYLFVGKIAVAISLIGSVLCAVAVDNLLELYKYIISIPAIFGAAVWLGFIWRRLTKSAVVVQVIVCVLIYAVIPNLFSTLDWAKYNEAFLKETEEQVVYVETEALISDVEAGRAERVGRIITKRHRIEPAGIFFEKVARDNPDDPNSRKVGLGRFHAELWVLSWFGVDFTGLAKSWLVALRFFFDALFPFVLLFLLSWVTKPAPKPIMDRFFAKIHTPIQPTPEADASALEEAFKHPEKFEKDKIFPNTNWELMKPAWYDYLGFFGSWVLVGLVILLLWLVVSVL